MPLLHLYYTAFLFVCQPYNLAINSTIWLLFAPFSAKKPLFFGKTKNFSYFLIHESEKFLRLFQKFTPESADYSEHEKFS